MTTSTKDRTGFGILLICIGVLAISVNDFLIKYLSDGYPLHQIVFARSAIGLVFSLVFVWLEGGIRILRTSTPGLHILRGLFVVAANLTFYAAVAVLPLAQATALFFIAPLFITLLSIPFLGESVGMRRMTAVVVGFVGVIVMQQPWANEISVSRTVLLLPVVSAFLYASMQIMTRRLGATTPASALAVYIQSMFLVVSLAFFVVAGDGRFAEGATNDSVIFLLRAWMWPAAQDMPIFIGLGVCSGIIGYALSAAYKNAAAATIAPFEYCGLPLAIFWGWLIFGEWPDIMTWIGCALIIGAGVFVFVREQQVSQRAPGARRRWARR